MQTLYARIQCAKFSFISLSSVSTIGFSINLPSFGVRALTCALLQNPLQEGGAGAYGRRRRTDSEVKLDIIALVTYRGWKWAIQNLKFKNLSTSFRKWDNCKHWCLNYQELRTPTSMKTIMILPIHLLIQLVVGEGLTISVTKIIDVLLTALLFGICNTSGWRCYRFVLNLTKQNLPMMVIGL